MCYEDPFATFQDAQRMAPTATLTSCLLICLVIPSSLSSSTKVMSPTTELLSPFESGRLYTSLRLSQSFGVVCLVLALPTSKSITVQAYRLHKEVLEKVCRKKLLFLHLVYKLASELTGIMPTKIDMCPKSYCAFTGKLKDLDKCTHDKKSITCNELKYKSSGRIKKL